MSALHALIIAFACYSAIPMPSVAWDDKGMRLMLAAFPLVGALVGICDLLWQALAGTLGFGVLLRGVGFAVIPLLVTGGIHLDGFADVTDALSSHADVERSQAILTDPHVGAFAVMGVSAYLLAYAALAGEIGAREIVALCCTPIVSRCLSGLATLTWAPARSEGMLATVRAGTDTRAVCVALGIELVLASSAAVLWSPWPATASLVAALAVFAWTRRLALRRLGGVSGDVAGYLLQLTELAMIAALVVVGRLV